MRTLQQKSTRYLSLGAAFFLGLAMMWGNQGIAQSIEEGSYYQIVAKHSGKAIDVPSANRKNGIGIIQWQTHSEDHQLFRFEEVRDGYYQIIAKHSGKALDVRGGEGKKQNGIAIQQWEINSQDNQLFRLQEAGNGYYRIIAKHSGKVIDVWGANTKNGVKLVQYENNGGTNQLFKLVPKTRYTAQGESSLGQEY